MNFLQILLGLAILIATIVIFIISMFRTPINLRGYYGVMYIALMLAGLGGGIALFAIGINGIVG